MISHLQAGDAGEPVMLFHLSPKAWDPWEPMVQIPVWGQEETYILAQVLRQKKQWILPSSAFLFYSGP